jgi:hypothetical protein
MSPIVTDKIYIYLFVHELFNDAVSILYKTALNNKLLVKNEFGRAWKEAAVPETEIGSMFVHLRWGNREFHKKCSQDSRFRGRYL